jgi:hypothetical protein
MVEDGGHLRLAYRRHRLLRRRHQGRTDQQRSRSKTGS